MTWFDFGGQRSPESHMLWTWYLKNTVREFCNNWHKYLRTLTDELIRFWWLKVKGHCNLTSCERAISRVPWGDMDMNSRMNWSNCGGQRSQALWHCLLWKRYLKNAVREFLQIWHKCQLRLKDERILDFTVSLNIVRNIFQECIEGFLSKLAQTYTWTRGWTD